jgi:hypothetical protein
MEATGIFNETLKGSQHDESVLTVADPKTGTVLTKDSTSLTRQATAPATPGSRFPRHENPRLWDSHDGKPRPKYRAYFKGNEDHRSYLRVTAAMEKIPSG